MSAQGFVIRARMAAGTYRDSLLGVVPVCGVCVTFLGHFLARSCSQAPMKPICWAAFGQGQKKKSNTFMITQYRTLQLVPAEQDAGHGARVLGQDWPLMLT